MKLLEKERVDTRVHRRYDEAQTPLDRLVAGRPAAASPPAVRRLLKQRARLDPFALAGAVEAQLPARERLRRGEPLGKS